MNSLDRTPGRPRKIDEAKRREICALIAVGCGIEAAARYVGCSAATVRRELDRDEDFRRAFASAELTCRIEPLRALRAAAATHWRAAAWLLESVSLYDARPATRLAAFQAACDLAEAVDTRELAFCPATDWTAPLAIDRAARAQSRA